MSEEEKIKMREEEKKYIEFMYNIENEYQCNNCPANKDDDYSGWTYPCGQFRCWVSCHCRTEEEEF